MRGNIRSRPHLVPQSPTGMNTHTQQSGLNLEKKVNCQTYSFLIIVSKDEEMAKFYDVLKAAESLHATAATIIQGPSTPLSQINM